MTGFLQRMPVIMRPLGMHVSSTDDSVLLGLMMVVSHEARAPFLVFYGLL